MENSNVQTPYSVNQNKSERPNIQRSGYTPITGFIAGSMNGGINKTIAWKFVMAGEKHAAIRLFVNFQQLTPITPTFQNLNMTVRVYNVPHKRVFKNAEEFKTQKGGVTVTKIKEFPNTGGQIIPFIKDYEDDHQGTPLYNLAAWRDSFISSYMPRMGNMQVYDSPNPVGDWEKGMMPAIRMPKLNILPLRGRRAIYNDFERNKEFDEWQQEYDGDTVSKEEWESYLPINGQMTYNNLMMRAKRPDSYYTDYRTELQGFDSEWPPDGLDSDSAFINWMNWEQKYSDAKKQAMDAQRNENDIIAEMGGCRKLTEGRVQKIGERTFKLNYSAITQTAYNNNNDVREDFRVLGKQGAFSFTQIDIPLYERMEFVEDGTIHVIATAQADTVFESGIDRTLLNVHESEQYRPELINDKNDVQYDLERGTAYAYQDTLEDKLYSVVGFKRKFSELFKWPNSISGDMVTQPWYDYYLNQNSFSDGSGNIITPNNTYQFFERSDTYVEGIEQHTGQPMALKAPWRDYTDLMINKNQAIQNPIMTDQTTPECFLGGNNQIFFMGIIQAIADLPVDDSIKDNYLRWGEH